MSLPESQLELAASSPSGDVVAADAVVGQSPTQLAIGRFRKDTLSMVSLVIVVIYTIAAIVAPILVKLGWLHPNRGNTKALNVNLGSIPTAHWGGVSIHHIFGIEPLTGADVFSRIWYGLFFSLTIAVSASLISVVVGVIFGIIGGFNGGFTDSVIGRIVDLTLSFPQTLMLLALSAPGVAFFASHLPGGPLDPLPNAVYEVLLLGMFGWPAIARLIRGQVLSIREREFIDAAVLLGASKRRIYFKEILPNLWAPVLIQFTLLMPAYVSAEAALGFLGVGIQPPTPTIGNILKFSVNYSGSDFEYFFFPALVLVIVVVTFNLLGDGMRDALDPKGDR
jgi:peptide/nickel transport system permease protein